MNQRQLLHAGCGPKGSELPPDLRSYHEVRLDADAGVNPDILASIVAMPAVPTESFDAVYCSHTLEHLFPHEVALALKEFHRVLKEDGLLLVYVPDLQSVGAMLAQDKADEPIYLSAIGPVTPLDMIYGHRASVAAGQVLMAHKTGFTASVMRRALALAGFPNPEIRRDRIHLMVRAIKEPKGAGIILSPWT
jgi:SAM-dependent methyltransferase